MPPILLVNIGRLDCSCIHRFCSGSPRRERGIDGWVLLGHSPQRLQCRFAPHLRQIATSASTRFPQFGQEINILSGKTIHPHTRAKIAIPI